MQDYFGISYHGSVATHLDALCHVWDRHGMWNGRDPEQEIGFAGAKFGSVDRWSDGIITRGVLLDIPKHRGEGFVTEDRPVHGWELQEVAEAQGVPSYLINGPEEIDPAWLEGKEKVGITSGASTPEVLVESVIKALAPERVTMLTGVEEDVAFTLPKELR